MIVGLAVIVERAPYKITGRQSAAGGLPLGDDAVIRLTALRRAILAEPVISASPRYGIRESNQCLAVALALAVGWDPGPHVLASETLARCKTARFCVSSRTADRRQVLVTFEGSASYVHSGRWDSNPRRPAWEAEMGGV